jgi:hypothetical protein
MVANGRKWLYTEGSEIEGRISCTEGLTVALSAFKEIQSLSVTDLEILVLAEYTFLSQELELCDSADTQAMNSLEQAIKDFDGAFLALHTVANADAYSHVEQCISHRRQYRYREMPKDAFHVACAGHKTRLDNILRSPGINLLEKTLLQQRYSNMKTAQSVYYKKQKESLADK